MAAANWVIDTEGILAAPGAEVSVDVLFDGRRIWSVAVHNEGAREQKRIPWPQRLQPFLDGRADVSLVETHSQKPIASAELSFGSGEGRVALADPSGRLMVIDKWGFLQRPFDLQDPSVAQELLDHSEDLLDILNNQCGVPAWIAFGSLLGAVRDGRVIGHDNDVDLAYLSSYESPVDIAREMFRITRVVQAAGYTVSIKSGSFITVVTKQADGTPRDIDIYACFYVEGYLYETASVRVKMPREAIVPLTTVTLEGRELAAPADPDRMLEASYGPGWRVPDPSFKYHTPREVTRRFDGWFGNYMKPRRPWENFYRTRGREQDLAAPTAFARWVAERESEPTSIIDLGCGNGRDTLHFASQGHRAVGMDFSRVALRLAARRAESAGVDVSFERLGLHDLRDTLTRGSLLAHGEPPRVLYARFLVEDMSPEARSHLGRFASMTLRTGGRLYLEFRCRVPRGVPKVQGDGRFRVDPARVVRLLERHGGRVVEQQEGRGLAVLGDDDPYVCRLVVDWPAPQDQEGPRQDSDPQRRGA